MGLSYRPLWKMLKNLDVSKMEFAQRINISNATLAKFSKNEPVALTVIEKICDEFNCNVSNVITYDIKSSPDLLPLDTLSIGTIVICPCYPLRSPIVVRSSSLKFHRKDIDCKRHTCVILEKHITGNDSAALLVAPLSYDPLPDTIFDLPFEEVVIDQELRSGYINLSKMGKIHHSSCEKILGQMPSNLLASSIKLSKKLKEVIDDYE